MDENAARLVASGVVVMGATVLLGQRWVLIPLALGFLARVLSGPRFSPLALLVTRVVVPRLGLQGRQVTGAPKRFAQGVGLTFSGSALVAWALGASTVTTALMVGLVAAASLEAVFGLCLGCKMYTLLQRISSVNERRLSIAPIFPGVFWPKRFRWLLRVGRCEEPLVEKVLPHRAGGGLDEGNELLG